MSHNNNPFCRPCFMAPRTPTLRGRSQLSTFMYSYRAYGGGREHDANILFLNVDLLLMLPPGGYD